MQFGDILRELLYENDLTQKQLAEALNMAASSVSSYVQNTRQPDFEILCRIADYFGVTTDYLLDYHPKSDSSPFEAELLRVFRYLTPEQQKIFIEQGKVFARLNEKERAKSSK